MEDFWCRFGKDVEHKVLITLEEKSKNYKAQQNFLMTNIWLEHMGKDTNHIIEKHMY